MFLRRSRPRSIRDRLIRSLTLLAAAACSLGAIGVAFSVYNYVNAGLLGQVIVDSALLGLMVEHDGKAYHFRYQPAAFETNFGIGSTDAYFQVWGPDGVVLAKSPSLGSRNLPLPPAPTFDPDFAPTAEELEIQEATLSAGESVLQGWIRWDPMRMPNEPPPTPELDRRVTVTVARDVSILWRSTLIAGAVAFAAVGLVLLGLRFVIVLAVDRGLQPLTNLSQEVARLDEKDFGGRFAVDIMPTETAPFAFAINSVLAKAEAALDRERRFSMSAAHELRTPIAEIRTAADVARRINSPEASALALASIVTSATLMEAVLSTLFRLAKRSGDIERDVIGPVQLSSLIDHALARHQARIAQQQITITRQGTSELIIMTEQAALSTIVTNLIDNAVEYTPSGGAIHVEFSQQAAAVMLAISNTPVSLSAQDVDRMGEPFWRKHQARGGGNHSGLGLALVKALIQSLEGTIEFRLKPPFTLHVIATLPHLTGGRVPPVSEGA